MLQLSSGRKCYHFFLLFFSYSWRVRSLPEHMWELFCAVNCVKLISCSLLPPSSLSLHPLLSLTPFTSSSLHPLFPSFPPFFPSPLLPSIPFSLSLSPFLALSSLHSLLFSLLPLFTPSSLHPLLPLHSLLSHFLQTFSNGTLSGRLRKVHIRYYCSAVNSSTMSLLPWQH